MPNLYIATPVLLGALLTGCTTTSVVKSNLLSDQDHGNGTVYSLPKQLVKITFSRTPLNSSETAANVKKLKDTIEAKKKEIKELTTEESALKKQIAKLSGDNKAEVEAKLNIELAMLQAKKLVHTAELSEKVIELNTATQDHTLALNSDAAYAEKLEITAEPITTDKKFTYSAGVDHSPMFSDNIELKSKNGLLDGALGHSDDKTSDIFVSIVSSLAAMKSPGSNKMVYRTLKRQPAAPTCTKSPVISVSQTIDPYEPKQLDIVNQLVRRGCIKISISSDGFDKQTQSTGPAAADGLVYRTPGILNFYVNEIIDNVGTTGPTPIGIIPVGLAQAGHSGYVSLPKGRFAKNEYDVSFSNGVLVKHKTVQPSEVLGAAMIVPNTIRGIFALPTELIKFKVDYSSSDKSIADSQKAVLAAQVEMEKLQMELEKLQKSN
ncbi:hypothetical protein [Pseudomonas sp. EYE_354]|uniref:hypothetical protein n=1 Tax=Pseudomonas sp. EYE_354 TaxID=2853449 RepID=UPI0020042136|nr:hypothetical protein [Pseudomonas sp. EYE_354]MCK6186841.1 hypothetical protein [Pseudomonas sp. EYE_354]